MPTNQFYTDMQLMATELLTEFGNPGVIQYIGPATGGTKDPDFASITGATTPDAVPIIGVVTSIDKKYVDGNTIKQTDHMLVADRQVIISRDGSIEYLGRQWKIIQVLPINPAAQLIVQKVAVRG